MNRIQRELIAFTRCFVITENNHWGQKATSIVFVTGWVILTLLNSIQSIQTVQPPIYGIYTAITFLILGRIWGLELDSLLDG